MNLKIKNFVFIIPLIILSLYYSIYQFESQSAVDGGIILSELVKFPEIFSNITSIFYNGWTILHHFTFILLKLGCSVDLVSIILIFIITIFYTIGIYLLVIGLNQSKILALLIAITVIISRENFGSVDYPVLYFSEHTYGAFSLSAFTLIAGLLSNKNYKTAGLISLLLLSSHLIVGLWVILILFISYFFSLFFLRNDEIDNYKKIIFGSLIIMIPIIISFLFFINNIIDKSTYNIEDYYIYLNQWDHHRNIIEINYDYIIKTILLIFILSIYFFNSNNKKIQIFYLFIVFSCFISLFVYMIVKLFPEFIPSFIVRAMPTRVFLLHSVIGYPIIISVFFLLIQKRLFNFINFSKKIKFIAIISFSFLIFIGIGINIDKIKQRYLEVKEIFIHGYNKEEKSFWNKVNKIKTDGYFITGFDSSGPLLRYARKPYLINTTYFDHIPYHPYTASETRVIIEEIYGISFTNPPIKFLGVLLDDWYKENFENRYHSEWLELSKKYNISGIITPSDWKLDLQNKIISKKFTAYIIN
jgi:hypothetical protein